MRTSTVPYAPIQESLLLDAPVKNIRQRMAESVKDGQPLYPIDYTHSSFFSRHAGIQLCLDGTTTIANDAAILDGGSNAEYGATVLSLDGSTEDVEIFTSYSRGYTAMEIYPLDGEDRPVTLIAEAGYEFDDFGIVAAVSHAYHVRSNGADKQNAIDF